MCRYHSLPMLPSFAIVAHVITLIGIVMTPQPKSWSVNYEAWMFQSLVPVSNTYRTSILAWYLPICIGRHFPIHIGHIEIMSDFKNQKLANTYWRTLTYRTHRSRVRLKEPKTCILKSCMLSKLFKILRQGCFCFQKVIETVFWAL